MEFTKTPISGCFFFKLKSFHDARGSFTKLFQQSLFNGHLISFAPTESFYSVSKKGVLRGMHFQTPPKDHDKVVICLNGKAFDAVFDLRKESETYGQLACVDLDAQAPAGLFIPRGCAHGFQALEDATALFYLTNQEYDPKHDFGIRWDSIEGLHWPLEAKVISERDGGFPSLREFESPF